MIKPEPGEHYWADSKHGILVVMCRGDGAFEVCGSWECGIPDFEVELVAHIKRPYSLKGKMLYYRHDVVRGDNPTP